MRSWRNLFRSLATYDWVLITVVIILVMIGLAAIYSVDLSRGSTLTFFPKQTIAFAIGMTGLFVAGALHVAFYRSIAKVMYIGSVASLILVLFLGSEIRGTTGWFRFAGFSFQPAELTRLAIILFLGWLIYRYGRRFRSWQFIVASGLVTMVCVGLIMLQPDLGSALVIAGIWFGLLLLVETKKRYIIGLLCIFVITATFGWFGFLKDYQKARLSAFINPNDPACAETTCYNVRQSLVAIGAGGITGRGLGFGSQSQLHFLPEAQTDFIFSVIAEELGLIGVMIIILLYMVLLWRLVAIAKNCQNDFATYTVLGIALVFLIQIVINIGGTTGLLPLTGVTLPFISYGGSSLIMSCLLIGIAESITHANKQQVGGLIS
ncbi:MAG: rod shape-determining protein RodA [Candidatus Magasanikbacteria bacterium]|jgi:rod shape determining protein RodA|nr:rod shape-determining protein RodA [Candidatus Magasanikbacteria bacterium]MBT4220665.1 rod shape-determining protein RodA [Candidatus Magasanikbacteria bacterium]MBT4350542.1 rod shape-determining protein RodA [Candidatus Magasanikbacteria bacterium]MBT6252753.1 rod shape-determining protein RodA [Candidatus Magasanikbacteria bacterium]MBT6334840.1 rod shape-determining protein RodA [Candidatus Magasanikbacteria bacterium]